MLPDPFSDILKFTNAESLVTGGFTAGGAWAIRFPAPNKIKFFAVVKGRCWASIDGEAEPVRFETGDVGLMAASRSFVLASDPAVVPIDAKTVFSHADRTVAQLGDGGDFTHIGGHVLLDHTSGRLLADALPPWIHLSAASPQAKTFRWLLDQLVEERTAGLPGAQLASAQLSQLLFIQILRAHLKTSGSLPAGWLRALSDPRMVPALQMMHGDPARPWHLDELAKACAMSRTMFALNFKRAAGVAPLAYLAGWRMHLAGRLLREGTMSIAAIAWSLGYASGSAFSNAFKRGTGQSPRAYRDAMRSSVPHADEVDKSGIHKG